MLQDLYLRQFILFFIFPILNSLECNITFIESDEYIYSSQSKNFIVENDSDDHSNIKENQFPLTQQLYKVQYNQEAQIINTIIIDSWLNEFLLEKQLCYLYKLQVYYITCIFNEGLFQNIGEQEKEGQSQQQFYPFIERFKIPIYTQIDENCEFLFQNNLLELSVFCTSLKSLNIYFINTNNLTITKQDYKIEEPLNKKCKIIYTQFIENSCLLIFYDCVSWAIYIYKNNLLKLLLNREIATQNEPLFNITLVKDIQICYENIVLIEDNQYYHYSYKTNNRLLLNIIQEISFLKQILFNNDCKFIQYFLVGSNNNNKFYIQNQVLNYELENTPKFVYFEQNIFFIIYEDELEVILNKKFKEKLKLKNFPLQFMKINNIFYQIDQVDKVIRFYKYKILNNSILRPSKKYLLFYSYYQQLISDSPSFCIQLINKEISNNIINYSFSLNCKCQNIETLFIQKTLAYLQDNYKIIIKQDLLNLIDIISDQQSFDQICLIPKNLLKNSKFLYYNSNDKAYSIFQTEKFLNILFCDNQQLIQIYIHNQKVFNYYDRFLFLEYQVDYFRFLKIQYDEPIYREYKLDSIIQEVFHCSNYVLIFTQSQSLILFDLNLELKVQLPIILNHLLLNIYQANINQNDKPKQFCFNIHRNSYIIQYYEHFIFLKNGNLYHFNLKQQQIIQIKQLNHLQEDGYQIIAVDINENVLIRYFFNLIDLILWQKYTFPNSKVIQPLAYQEVQEFFTIGVITKNISYTHIFSVSETKQLKLKQTIQINQNHTFISFKKLYYFNKNNEIQVLDLHNLYIQFKPLLKKQNNVKLNETLMFYITNNSSKVLFNVNLSIFVNCAKLIPLYNQFSIILDKNNHKIIDLNDLFEGTIDILKIQDNSNVLLEGPFIISQIQNELQIETYIIEQFKVKVNLTTIQSFSNYKQIIKISVQDEYLIISKFGRILKGFYINNYQIMFIYFIEGIIKAQIFRINQDDLSLIQDSNEFIINDAYDHQDIIQIGNLFQTRNNLKDIIFYVQNGNIYELSNKNGVENLFLIQNSNQMYLQLKFDNSYNFLTINTIKILQMELDIIHQFIFDFNKIQEDLSQYVNYINDNKQQQKNIYPLSAFLNNQTLNIKCLIILEDFSILQFIQIDQDNGNINYTFFKIARHPYNQIFYLHFIDENYLILYEGQNNFIFDFRLTKQIHDFSFYYSGNINKLYSYNTTHYIIQQDDINSFTIMQIGYRISIMEDQIKNETCILIAENKISKAQIILQVNKIQNQNKYMLEIMQFGIVFFILIITLLILYFFIRRSFLKQTVQQPSREFSFLSQ
ncbi:unnamed protein product [Paramecium primaurelia]|uniref:Transmembrane protein n=1 Tax=Paramecium primaurelia TaxID=5886 RepID=A0A8S1Q9Y4_PARPR|nr:unnamed protein product [Paramecium primaurelia]